MNLYKLIIFLIRIRLSFLAYFLLTILSLLLGKLSKFRFFKNQFWIQKQENIYLVDFYPKYRLNLHDHDSSAFDIFFNEYTPKLGDICVDVGSGLGTDTRLMSKLVGNEGVVYSIEATKSVFEALKLNVKLNNLENVVVSNCAISNKNETIKVIESPHHHTQNRIAEDCIDGIFHEVDGLTMDTYIINQGIKYIDFLKVNIEGAEKQLIEGFTKIRKVKHIAISTHDFLGKRTGDKFYFSRDLIEQFLNENDFEFFLRNTGIDYIDGWIFGYNKALIND